MMTLTSGVRPANPLPRMLTREDRRIVARHIESLIALLDEADGDCDLEDDDPAGDHLDSYGEPHSDDGARISALRPAYGIDQRRGPINHPLAVAGYLAQMEGR